MKQALEIDDHPELAEFKPPRKQQIIFVFQNGRFGQGL
jgi:hypothetical protein